MEEQDIDKFLNSIVIGLRYRQHFIIQDRLGEIVDAILYADGSYYNPQVFPLIQEGIGHKRLVSDDEGKDSLLIGHTDIVLDMRISDKDNVKSKIGEIVSSYEKQLIKGIIGTYKIDQINRIGCIRRYIINDSKIASSFIKKTLGDSIKDVSDVQIRFSKKLPIEKALLDKKYDDYENVIYHVATKEGDHRLFLSVDYQHIFDPPADDAQDIKYSQFMKIVSEYNSQKLIQWINHYEK